MAQEEMMDAKPPYVAYTTFKHLLDGFREGVLPARIDRTVMAGQSGQNQTYLIAALKFFGLIDGASAPTKDMRDLMDKDEATRKKTWNKIVQRAYGFILASGLDLASATEGQVLETINEKGLQGSTARKCYTFFVAATEDADIKLGHHLKPRSKGVKRGPYKKRARGTDNRQQDEGEGESGAVPPIEQQSVHAMLLAKFPNFDPAWTDDLKKKWFEGFENLMASAKKE